MLINQLLIQLMHIQDNYAHIYATYEITGNNNQHIYNLHAAVYHVVIYPWINMATMLYMYVPLQFYL